MDVKQAYIDTRFSTKNAQLVRLLDKIIGEYQRAGYMLSVRQLYYQLVARDIVENTERSYKRVASIINDARLAGYLDWDAIEDRGRDIVKRAAWGSGKSVLRAAAEGFHMDMWDNQDTRVFVVVEKAALAGVLGGLCHTYDVPLLAARGYPSASIVREMALEHFMPAIDAGQDVVVLHCGDHDPSGIDMTRDLRERFELFLGAESYRLDLQRIALTMDQIDEKEPPPNPAKVTDSRFEEYARLHGDESWELDALEPAYLDDLVTTHVRGYIDDERWDERQEEIESIRTRITEIATNFEN